jgi:hypothetical protein
MNKKLTALSRLLSVRQRCQRPRHCDATAGDQGHHESSGYTGLFIRRSLGLVGPAHPPILRFIDAAKAIYELPSYDSFEPAPEGF